MAGIGGCCLVASEVAIGGAGIAVFDSGARALQVTLDATTESWGNPTMPNGWYPVDGLDVVHVNRTEQGHPRFEWEQSWDVFWAAAFYGPRGYAPLGALANPTRDKEAPFATLVADIQAILVEDPHLSDTQAGCVYIDFKQRQGFVTGPFCVYEFVRNETRILRNPTLGAQLTEEQLAAAEMYIKEIPLARILPRGMKDGDAHAAEAIDNPFHFPDADTLIVSSVPLHYIAPLSPSDPHACVMHALSRERGGDMLIALWHPSRSS